MKVQELKFLKAVSHEELLLKINIEGCDGWIPALNSITTGAGDWTIYLYRSKNITPEMAQERKEKLMRVWNGLDE